MSGLGLVACRLRGGARTQRGLLKAAVSGPRFHSPVSCRLLGWTPTPTRTQTQAFRLPLLQIHRRGLAAHVGKSSAGGSLYELLGVERDATVAEIKSGYFKLSRQYHPDTASVPDVMKFKAIGEAYTTLSNPDRRRAYDATLGLGGTVYENSGPSKVHESMYAEEQAWRQTQLNTQRITRRKERAAEGRMVEIVDDIHDSRLYWYIGFVLVIWGAYWLVEQEKTKEREARRRFVSRL